MGSPPSSGSGAGQAGRSGRSPCRSSRPIPQHPPLQSLARRRELCRWRLPPPPWAGAFRRGGGWSRDPRRGFSGSQGEERGPFHAAAALAAAPTLRCCSLCSGGETRCQRERRFRGGCVATGTWAGTFDPQRRPGPVSRMGRAPPPRPVATISRCRRHRYNQWSVRGGLHPIKRGLHPIKRAPSVRRLEGPPPPLGSPLVVEILQESLDFSCFGGGYSSKYEKICSLIAHLIYRRAPAALPAFTPCFHAL